MFICNASDNKFADFDIFLIVEVFVSATLQGSLSGYKYFLCVFAS